MKLIIGTRGSPLALSQANWIRDRLVIGRHHIEIRIIETAGDQSAEASGPPAFGLKGVFVKEIEEALLNRTIDVAVHSLKDVPLEQPSGLTLAAIARREDPSDVLVCRDGVLHDGAGAFEALPAGARVGTSSLRRQAQLRHLRPELEYVPVRGNVDTRLRKLDAGEYDALVLAAAGLLRLGLEARVSGVFTPEQLCPAPGQGALAIETRADTTAEESTERAVAASLDDRVSRHAVRAERAVVWCLGGDCSTPIGAYAESVGDRLAMVAVVASPDGRRVIRARGSESLTRPEQLGNRVADELLRQGAREILESLAPSPAVVSS
jgi:hydroxymethylbilane synthase